MNIMKESNISRRGKATCWLPKNFKQRSEAFDRSYIEFQRYIIITVINLCKESFFYLLLKVTPFGLIDSDLYAVDSFSSTNEKKNA